MLVLARMRGQSVIINDEIEVRVTEIRGDKVRLGFLAPETVVINRKELHDQIKNENRAAAGLQPADLKPAPPPNAVKERFVSDPFLKAAIEEAQLGLKEGGLPIGSVLVRNNQIIGRGHNRRVQHGDPMAHAEINCLTQAGRQASYKDTVLYSTLMPCYLCTGAVVQFGIPKVIVGESVTFPGGEGKWGKSPDFLRANGIEVIDLHDADCIAMMTQFIRDNPKLWNEDIGV